MCLMTKTAKAQGPDNIHPRILKELAVEIAPSLTLIFRKSYETGEVPTDWLKANVSPIFKNGQKYLASNYRPISLTCIASKLMEHILVSNMMKHAQSHNILYDLAFDLLCHVRHNLFSLHMTLLPICNLVHKRMS